jgi:hypothetical protein
MNQRDSAGSAVMRLDTVEVHVFLKIMGIGNWEQKLRDPIKRRAMAEEDRVHDGL